MSKFKIGDKVRCINGNYDVPVGHIGIVSYVEEDYEPKDWACLQLDNLKKNMYQARFELVEEEKPVFKKMKFRVNSPAEAEALQKYLFSLGYKWTLYGKEVNHTNETCFYTGGYSEGIITYGIGGVPQFAEWPYEEYKVDFVTTVSVASIRPVRDTILADDKKYYKDEYEKAIAGLKVVEE